MFVRNHPDAHTFITIRKSLMTWVHYNRLYFLDTVLESCSNFCTFRTGNSEKIKLVLALLSLFKVSLDFKFDLVVSHQPGEFYDVMVKYVFRFSCSELEIFHIIRDF